MKQCFGPGSDCFGWPWEIPEGVSTGKQGKTLMWSVISEETHLIPACIAECSMQ